MPDLNQLLLIVHFLALGLGLSATVVHLVLRGLIAGADPAEARGLAKLRPVMAQVGGSGLLLLWATGLMLVFMKWGGFGRRGEANPPVDPVAARASSAWIAEKASQPNPAAVCCNMPRRVSGVKRSWQSFMGGAGLRPGQR